MRVLLLVWLQIIASVLPSGESAGCEQSSPSDVSAVDLPARVGLYQIWEAFLPSASWSYLT